MGALKSTAEPFPWVPLLVLSSTAFFMVTSEFVPTGLLPIMARDLRVSASQIGLLVTLFAFMVVLSSLPLTAVTQRFSRKSLVIVVLSVFIAANILGALAPNYFVLAIARIIGGMCHGLFWSVVGAYAAHMVSKRHLARAITVSGSGATVAFVLGIPLATALGLAVGWRLTFIVIAACQFVVIWLVVKFVPQVDHRPPLTTGEISVPMRKHHLMPVFITISIIQATLVIGQYAFYSYIAPFLLGPTGFPEAAIVPVLFAYGISGAVSLFLAPYVANRFGHIGLVAMIVIVILGLLAIGFFPGQPVVVITALVFWGVAFGVAPVIMQARIMGAATARTRDVASAFMNTAYNIGIGGGALIGGLVLDHVGIGSDPADFVGLRTLPFVAVLFMAITIVIVIATDSRTRPRETRLVS